MPLYSPKVARDLFADLTQHSTVPLDADELLHTDSMSRLDCVVIGGVALRCYKHKARWTYDERDIRRAGKEFADFALNRADTVEVELPFQRRPAEPDAEGWGWANWRRQLAAWMLDEAFHKTFKEPAGPDGRGEWRRIGPNGLPGGLTMDEFLTGRARARLTQTIAGTRPLTLLAWSGTSWLLPRAYVDLLDRWERLHGELAGRARICSGCQEKGPVWGGWRTPTKAGFTTLCPPCTGAVFRPYEGHLRGIAYDSARRRGTPADDYLCRLCRNTRAIGWDHCHDHGFVRGPLCAQCNTCEGSSRSRSFLRDREGAAQHLLECRGCRDQRTLPRRYHPAVAAEHLESTERHGRCRHRPYADHVEPAHGAHLFKLRCDQHWTASWTKEVSAGEAARLVRAYVVGVLAEAAGADPQ
ncbi:endonuclease domain-containing protein [Streptomyces sp. JV176]|uniref:endonuclease domain-containing protein n=1 Tax=Streptomyces sp. JV176 TaxID=858630 RepID=UPI002E781AC6|nr:endonuclease domain-containing protein [Streptomyces sp. JV176]MEE1797276.1 endonuclease domain-containing protein [Streptomyces sp. JV176]